jgi:AraC-like DNA-binding protein
MGGERTSAATLDVVERHNARWARGDFAGVAALYAAHMQFVDHFCGRRSAGEALRAHVRGMLERSQLGTLQYLDRPRVDGEWAFLRYAERMRAADGSALLHFTACDAVRMQGGLIVEINEYALPVTPAPRRSVGKGQTEVGGGGAAKIGLSPRALGFLLKDLEQYLVAHRPFLDPALSLSDVAAATGYTRNQISCALNQGLGQGFHEYVNGARIRRMLAAGLDRGALIAQAREAGFRSTSTFYARRRPTPGTHPTRTRPGARRASSRSCRHGGSSSHRAAASPAACRG